MKRRRAEPVRVRALAAGILDRVERGGAIAQPLVERAVERLDDPRDARLLRALVFGPLRQRGRLDHAIDAVASRPVAAMDPPLPSVLRVATFELLFLDRVPEFATVDEALRSLRHHGGTRAASFVNGVLREIARRGADLLPPDDGDRSAEGLARRHSHPAWWVARLLARHDPETVASWLAAANDPPPWTLCVPEATIDALRVEIERAGGEARRGDLAPTALHVAPGDPVALRALAAGDCHVQDEAAQLVVALFSSRSDAAVLDLCAAPGGKTLQLAERFPDSPALVAADRHPRRLRRLVRNLERCRRSGILVVTLDGADRPGALSCPFDRILVDAPCSGSGTMRRHPEIRWRLREEDLGRYRERQIDLLDAACDRLAPGGELVYSVCSIEPEEGTQVVDAVVARRDDVRRAPAADRLGSAGRSLATGRGDVATGLTPGIDGFFAALLLRR